MDDRETRLTGAELKGLRAWLEKPPLPRSYADAFLALIEEVEAARTLRSVEPPRGREWLVIENSMKNAVFADEEARTSKGYFPRDVAEKLLGRDLGGTVWFTNVESELMREHPDWRDTEPPAVEPPLRERAAKFLDHFLHDYGKEAFEEATERLAAELTALRSQTLDEAARVADKKAEESHRCMLMRKQACELQDAMAYSMDESVAKEIAAAIRALPLPPGIK